MSKVVKLCTKPVQVTSTSIDEGWEFLSRLFLMHAFVTRPNINIFRTLKTVSVSFASEIEAEEFAKLLRGARRGAR